MAKMKRRGQSTLESISMLCFVLLMNLLKGQSFGIPSFGKCPDLPVFKNFNVSRYLGKFYEIEKYFSLLELGGICVTTNYTDLGNGTMGVYNSKTQALSRQRTTTSGTARVVDEDESAKMVVSFPSLPLTGESPYWVMDTDYDNYSIVWSCSSFPIINFQIVWFLSRSRFPDEEIKQKVYQTMESLGLSTSRLQKTEQRKRKCPEIY